MLASGGHGQYLDLMAQSTAPGGAANVFDEMSRSSVQRLNSEEQLNAKGVANLLQTVSRLGG